MAFTLKKIIKGVWLKPETSDPSENAEGSIWSNSTSNRVKTYIQGSIREIVTNDQSQTLTNKTIVVANNTITTAASGNLAATELNAALAELQGDIDTRALATDLSNHINDTTDAHDASAISNVPSGNLVATDVQAALNELQGDIDTINADVVDDVEGPASATDEALARFDGTTGKLIQNSVITATDAGIMSGITQLNVDNLRVDGNDISSTNTNGNINIIPNGTGIADVQKDVRFRQDIQFDQTNDAATGSNATLTAPASKHIRLTNGSLVSIDMIPAGSSGQEIILVNATGTQITINNDTGATAANRILTGKKSPIQLKDEASLPLIYDSTEQRWIVAAGVGDDAANNLDVMFQDNFETSILSNYTQTGLSLDTAAPLHDRVSAKLTHQPATSQSFKRTYSVDRKFRGKNMTIKMNVKSAATAGNVTLNVYDETNAANLIASEQMTLSSANGGAESKHYFDLPATCTSLSYTVTAMQESGSPETFVDDVVCYISQTEIVQSALVQEADSSIKVSVANGYGSTATKIRRFSTIDQVMGSDITYVDDATNGASFTINTPGIYHISYNEYSATVRAGITLNSSNLTTNVSTLVQSTSNEVLALTTQNTTDVQGISWSGWLNSGDIIRPHTDGAAATDIDAIKFTISKQGSLKQANVASDQKIKIPSSELRFQGASARGAVATAIVKFDSLSNIRGDAFTITNTANDGTYVTMNKAGKLDISTSLVGLGTFQITRNQVTLTANSTTASEVLASTSSSSTDRNNLKTSTSVQIGDIIRISSNVNPSANVENSLNLYFQEQDIQVSVSNTLPQYSESDSEIRVYGGNGFCTATVTRRYSNLDTNIGTDLTWFDSTSDSYIQVNTDGVYSITVQDETGGSSGIIGIAKNSNTTTSINSETAPTLLNGTYQPGVSSLFNCSWQGYLVAGDRIRVKVNATGNVNSTSTQASFTVTKVGKPNVTGVNVTPFVNTALPTITEWQDFSPSITATTTNPTFGTTSINRAQWRRVGQNMEINWNFHQSTAGTAGSGLYLFNLPSGYIIDTSKVEVNTGLTVDDVRGTVGSIDYAVDTQDRNGSGMVSAYSTTQLRGQFVSATNANSTGLTGSWDSGSATFANANFAVSIRASIPILGWSATDNSLLNSIETFSTDTNTLTYAGSATYTLSTLANAPVGTFITFTYASSSNTRTQTNAAAPTQTTSDMNTNGIRIFTRAYNAASTSGSPACVAIQIGKGMKGINLGLYKNTGKTISMVVDTVVPSSTDQHGLVYRDYDETTGVLIIDAGACYNTTNTQNLFLPSDRSAAATSGYVVINASKQPALTGVGSNIRAVRLTNTAGTSVANTGTTKIPFDASISISNGLRVDAANNRVYCDESGLYDLSASIQFASSTYAAGNIITIQAWKNGAVHSVMGAKTIDAAVTAKQGIEGTDQVRLSRGDYIEFYASNSRTAGATALSTTAGECFMNIAKKGGIV